jgi:hypothetical protein
MSVLAWTGNLQTQGIKGNREFLIVFGNYIIVLYI